MPLPPDTPMNQPPFNSRIQMVPVSAWAADETPAPAKANRATRAARNLDENLMITPVSLDDSQTGIGRADFDETMTDQLGDLAAGFADVL